VRPVWSAAARRDLLAIAQVIAADNPARARSYIAELRAACQRLLDAPHGAVARPELADGLRMWPFGRYLIFDLPLPEAGVRIVRVLHGARDIARLFESGE
jgi:toxin ParE1/3/4